MPEHSLHQVGQAIAEILAQPWVSLLACVALTSPYWLSAASKALDFPGAVAEVRGLAGIEPAALIAVLVIAVQFGGSLLVIWGGRWAWIGAAVLAGFTVLATLLAHSWWTKTGPDRVRDFNAFWEHMGLVGGFILAAILSARE